MYVRKIAGTAMIAAALGIGSLGLGGGLAQADPGRGPDIPWIPGPGWVDWNPGVNIPPGQAKKMCPWNSPPGHWTGGPHGIPCS